MKSMTLILGLSLAWTAAYSQQDCQPVHWGKFCLGGQVPDGYFDQSGNVYYYTVGEEFQQEISAHAVDGRIAKIATNVEPASWANLIAARDALTQKYGQPEDRSYLPAGTEEGGPLHELMILGGEAAARYVWTLGDWETRLSFEVYEYRGARIPAWISLQMVHLALEPALPESELKPLLR